MDDDTLYTFRNDDDLDFEEDMQAEGRIMDEEAKLCAICLTRPWTLKANGLKVCEPCNEQYPQGHPF